MRSEKRTSDGIHWIRCRGSAAVRLDDHRRGSANERIERCFDVRSSEILHELDRAREVLQTTSELVSSVAECGHLDAVNFVVQFDAVRPVAERSVVDGDVRVGENELSHGLLFAFVSGLI